MKDRPKNRTPEPHKGVALAFSGLATAIYCLGDLASGQMHRRLEKRQRKQQKQEKRIMADTTQLQTKIDQVNQSLTQAQARITKNEQGFAAFAQAIRAKIAGLQAKQADPAQPSVSDADLQGLDQAVSTAQALGLHTLADFGVTEGGDFIAPADAAPAPASETPAPASETPAPASETPAPASETPAPASETPAPASETPAPDLATPAPTADTPAPTADTPAPTADTPAPTADATTAPAPAPVSDTAAAADAPPAVPA